MNVAFLVNDLQLSGGVGVVVAHARQLAARHGIDTTLVLTREWKLPHWAHQDLEHVHVAALDEAREQRFDVAVSTWWETAFSLFDISALRYACFVQSLEDRFFRTDEAERFLVSTLLGLPVAFITEARWIAATLRDLRPDARCHLVRNGIDKRVFAPLERVEPNVDRPLRILVEGYANVWFKGVNEAIATVGRMREAHELTVVAPMSHGLWADGATRVLGPVSHREMAELYGRSDVVLKLSRVEGMFGPPLEGFHRGATCVTTPVTGHEEYIEHGHNALLVEWDDRRGTAHQLDLLARDRVLLHELRSNALETARRWPSWEQSGQFMAAALRAIDRAPQPATAPALRTLLADLHGALEVQRLWAAERRELDEKVSRYELVLRLPGVRRLLALRRRPAGRALRRLLRPLARLLLRDR